MTGHNGSRSTLGHRRYITARHCFLIALAGIGLGCNLTDQELERAARAVDAAVKSRLSRSGYLQPVKPTFRLADSGMIVTVASVIEDPVSPVRRVFVFVFCDASGDPRLFATYRSNTGEYPLSVTLEPTNESLKECKWQASAEETVEILNTADFGELPPLRWYNAWIGGAPSRFRVLRGKEELTAYLGQAKLEYRDEPIHQDLPSDPTTVQRYYWYAQRKAPLLGRVDPMLDDPLKIYRPYDVILDSHGRVQSVLRYRSYWITGSGP